MRSPVSVRLIPHNPRTQIRCSVYPRQPFFLWGWHIMSCFQKLTFLPVFEKCWCPTCSMQMRRSECLCGIYSWDLPCKRIHEFSWLLATLSSGEGEERESWVILCLLMDGRKTTDLRLENFISTVVVCCCPLMGVFPHYESQCFFPFKAGLFVDSSPTGSTSSLLYRKQVSMCNQSIAWRNFKL